MGGDDDGMSMNGTDDPLESSELADEDGKGLASPKHFGGITAGGRLKCKTCEFEAVDITSFLHHRINHSRHHKQEHNDDDDDECCDEDHCKLTIPNPVNRHQYHYHGHHHRRKSLKQNRVLPADNGTASQKHKDTPPTIGSPEVDARSFWESLGLRSKTDVARKERSLVFSVACRSSAVEEWLDHSGGFGSYLDVAGGAASPDTVTDLRMRIVPRLGDKEEQRESSSDTDVDYLELDGAKSLDLSCPRKIDASAITDSRFDVPSSSAKMYSGNVAKSSYQSEFKVKLPKKLTARVRGERVTTTEADDAAGMSKRKRKLRTCEKCGYITDNLTTLQRHAAKHGSAGRHRCLQCDYSVDRQHILDYHVRHVHESDAMLSHDNGSHLLSRETAVGEDDIRASETALNLHIDDKQLTLIPDTERLTEANVAAPKPPVIVSVPVAIECQLSVTSKREKMVYGCSKCQFRTRNVTNAANHARQHGAGKKYTCHYCDYSLNQRRHIATHMVMQHTDLSPPVVKDNGIALYPTVGRCSTGVCRYQLLDKIHLSGGRGSCIGCGYASLSYTAMVRHRLNRTNCTEKVYRCCKCRHVSTTRPLLVRHLTMQHGVAFEGEGLHRLYQCGTCPFRSSTMARLAVHRSHHGANKRIACDRCDFRSRSENVMAHHRKLHRAQCLV